MDLKDECMFCISPTMMQSVALKLNIAMLESMLLFSFFVSTGIKLTGLFANMVKTLQTYSLLQK
jgi:hypothetical protein